MEKRIPETGYKPLEDGSTHINCFSKGQTLLGRQLSHFSPIGFTHQSWGRFTSVEGFWYWNKTGRTHDELRDLHGHRAKHIGQTLPVVLRETFETEVEEAIALKITQNPQLLETFKASKLWLTHYYVVGSGIEIKAISTRTTIWFEKTYNELRDKLNDVPAVQKVLEPTDFLDEDIPY